MGKVARMRCKDYSMAEVHIHSITDVHWYVVTSLFLHRIQLTVIDFNEYSRSSTAHHICAVEQTREHIKCIPRSRYNFEEAFTFSHSVHACGPPHRHLKITCNIKSTPTQHSDTYLSNLKKTTENSKDLTELRRSIHGYASFKGFVKRTQSH